jgi:hypothetical protein
MALLIIFKDKITKFKLYIFTKKKFRNQILISFMLSITITHIYFQQKNCANKLI